MLELVTPRMPWEQRIQLLNERRRAPPLTPLPLLLSLLFSSYTPFKDSRKRGVREERRGKRCKEGGGVYSGFYRITPQLGSQLSPERGYKGSWARQLG